jgi:hypothetical protein
MGSTYAAFKITNLLNLMLRAGMRKLNQMELPEN